jgi:hypothetical protein
VSRKERRAANARTKKLHMKWREIDQNCDIQVDAKIKQIVMIFANRKGRQVVEELWPDVQWTTDEIFAPSHSPEWLYTHVRVTKLPPPFEEKVPLAFASPDALGLAVAMALQHFAEPRRVAHWRGQGRDIGVAFYDVRPNERDLALSLFVEHAPAGTYVGDKYVGSDTYVGAPESKH